MKAANEAANEVLCEVQDELGALATKLVRWAKINRRPPQRPIKSYQDIFEQERRFFSKQKDRSWKRFRKEQFK